MVKLFQYGELGHEEQVRAFNQVYKLVDEWYLDNEEQIIDACTKHDIWFTYDGTIFTNDLIHK